MTSFGSQLLLGLQVLAMPLNLLALLGGTLAGAVLGTMFRHIGVSGAAALVLLMPIATLLDPTTGVVLLGACLTGALIATAHHNAGTTLTALHHNVPLAAMLGGLVIMLASTSAAALLQTAAPADTIALLAMGAASAIALAALTHPAGWPAAMALTVAGIAAQLSPLQPLDTEHASPMPLLFGLLVFGPAAIAIARPQRITPWSTSFGGIELAATVVPALLIGIPAARGISVFALSLSENGLSLGPRLMTQRPKLVFGFILALVAAGCLAMIGRLLADRLPRASWWPRVQPLTRTRVTAFIILALSVTTLYLSGFNLDTTATEAAQPPLFLLAISAGALAAWFGLELAPLVTGLVIGNLLQPPLRAALSQADGHLWTALGSGSTPLLLLAIMAMAATVAWPIYQRRLIP